MPPQKNSGARGSQRVTPTTRKNNTFLDAYMSDLRKDGKVEDIHVGRVIRNVGNGRVDVFYVGPIGARTERAYIRGIFRGKGKHSINIDVNSTVLLADNNIGGAAQYEIMCMLSPDQIRELRKVVELDPRILNRDVTDDTELLKGEMMEIGGFEFDAGEEVKFKDDADEDVDVDAI